MNSDHNKADLMSKTGLCVFLAIVVAHRKRIEPVGESWVVESSGCSERAVRTALKKLQECGYLKRSSWFKGWMLAEGWQELDLPGNIAYLLRGEAPVWDDLPGAGSVNRQNMPGAAPAAAAAIGPNFVKTQLIICATNIIAAPSLATIAAITAAVIAATIMAAIIAKPILQATQLK